MPHTILRSALKPDLVNIYGWSEDELGVLLYALDHLSRTGDSRIHGIAAELCQDLNDLYARNLSEKSLHSIYSQSERMESDFRHERIGPPRRPVS